MAPAVALRALTMAWTALSLSCSRRKAPSKAPVRPVCWSCWARCARLRVRAAKSCTMRSQSPKHWWQGWQAGKSPAKPREHWSQRTPDTPGRQEQCPVTRWHCGVSIPRGSQSQAADNRNIVSKEGFGGIYIPLPWGLSSMLSDLGLPWWSPI